MKEGILALDRNFEIININEAAIKLLAIKGIEYDTEILEILEGLNIKLEFNSSIYNNQTKTIIKNMKIRYWTFPYLL